MSEWIVEIGDGNPHIKSMKELVRCKDCKFYIKHSFLGAIQKWCERLCNEFDRSMPIATNDDDFCSYGERREVKE